jgi:hypothetical protein
MRVFIGGEQFGVIRTAFRELGHEAWSCDLEPTRDGSPHHLRGDMRHYWSETPDGQPWDLGIFHPDCTFFTNSAAWAYKDPDCVRYPGVGYHQKIKPETLVGADRRAAREGDATFVREIVDECPIKKKAVENPRGYLSAVLGKPSQSIQPNQFGDDASKETCLWLYDLPLLVPTLQIEPRYVDGRPRWANQTDSGQNKLAPGPTRAADRARTYQGIARAMAAQWGNLQPPTPGESG